MDRSIDSGIMHHKSIGNLLHRNHRTHVPFLEFGRLQHKNRAVSPNGWQANTSADKSLFDAVLQVLPNCV